jgi:ATP-dependent RNA helicase RhlE
MRQNEQITFGDLGVSIDLLELLEAQKIIHPTPIQEKCIALGMRGRDIVGVAQTGTGKTLAFGLPIIEKLKKGKGKCVIMLPTRELAIQVEEVLFQLARHYGIRVALLIGGVSMHQQKVKLRKTPDIIIATPGRLNDHIQRNTVNLQDFTIMVLDEADRMLDIGFMPQIKLVLSVLPEKRQTMLFSATMPPEITELASKYMKNPTKIEVAPSGTSAKNINQEAIIVHSDKKAEKLNAILRENNGSTLVFTRTKHKAKRIANVLRKAGFEAVEMHSNRTLGQRRSALEGFKSGKYQVLVATDVAARGLDVDDISLIINFNLPQQVEDYVHRIGRTGRAGKSGKAISFIEPNELHKFRQIEYFVKRKIDIVDKPSGFFLKSVGADVQTKPTVQKRVSKKTWDNRKKARAGASQGSTRYGRKKTNPSYNKRRKKA